MTGPLLCSRAAGPNGVGAFPPHRTSRALQGALQNRLLAVTTINSTTTTEHPAPRVDDSTFDLYVELEADDLATPEQLDVLEADEPAWRASLLRLLVDADEHLVAARRLTGEERDQVVADAEYTHRILTDALLRLTGERRPGTAGPGRPAAQPAPGEVGEGRRSGPGQAQGRSAGRRRGQAGPRTRGRRTRRRAPPAVVGAGSGRRLGRWPRLPRRHRRGSGEVPGRGRSAGGPLDLAPRGERPRWREGVGRERAGGRGARLAGRRRFRRRARRRRPERALAGQGRHVGGRARGTRRHGPGACDSDDAAAVRHAATTRRTRCAGRPR